MKTPLRLTALARAGILLVATPSRAVEKSDKQAVKAAAMQFYAALNAMFTGDIAPMKTVWSHAADVTYMGPSGGFQVGWKSVLASWESQAALKLGGHVDPKQMVISAGSDLAVTSNLEVGRNKNAAGREETVSIRATNVFRKENGAWKMIGHHTDLLPYLKK
jgi:ketosteroid isomerase-like protein